MTIILNREGSFFMRNLSINITSKCNAECKHCCFSCSPYSNVELSKEEVWNAVNYGIRNEEIKEIAITGGEPLLYENLVCDIIKKISDSGKIVTCITNGFWGKNKLVAKEKLKKLSDLGLKFLTISCDEFHNEYIDIECINNILEASLELPIRVSINMTVTKSKNGNELLFKLKDNLLGIPVTRFSAEPVGNARDISKEELYYKLSYNNKMKCSEPTSGLVIHHDGYVYPCCSPLVFETILKIGSIRNYTLEELDKKFNSNILIYIIKKEGLSWFVEKCKDKGINKFNDKYISSCHLCYEIFKNDYIANLLIDDIKEYCEYEIQKV